MMKTPESKVLSFCEKMLTAHGIMHWRNNTGAVKVEKRFIRYGCKGSPDIIAVHEGRFIGIECKGTGGVQQPSQKAFQERLEAAGGLYLLVTPNNMDSALEVVT